MIKKNYSKDYKFIKQFLDLDGISGHEHEVAEKFKKIAKEAGAKISRGGLGSVIAKIGTKGPKLMIAAHMDEVGFVISRIEKNGFLRVSLVGGSWPHIVVGLPVKVITENKKVYNGTIGSTSIHVLPKEKKNIVISTKDLYIDLGFDSDKEIKDANIDIGDIVIRQSETKLIGKGDKFMGKAADNRYGLAIAAKVLEKLKDKKLECQLFMVGSSQEEVGLRGAKASVKLVEPDIAFGLDTTVSHDTPDIIPGNTKLGAGVAITVKDRGTLPNPMLLKMMFNVAIKEKIDAYKYVSQGGGNDTEELQYSNAGIPAVSLAIPTRYLHTVNEIGSLKDFNDYVNFLVAFILEFNENKYQKLLYK